MYFTWWWSGPHHTFPSTTARDRIESRKSTSRKIRQLIGLQKNGWWAQPYSRLVRTGNTEISSQPRTRDNAVICIINGVSSHMVSIQQLTCYKPLTHRYLESLSQDLEIGCPQLENAKILLQCHLHYFEMIFFLVEIFSFWEIPQKLFGYPEGQSLRI